MVILDVLDGNLNTLFRYTKRTKYNWVY